MNDIAQIITAIGAVVIAGSAEARKWYSLTTKRRKKRKK